jgi:hypothetical protein
MSDGSSSHVTNAGASLPKSIEEKRALAAKARKIYRERSTRWKRLMDALEERTLKAASDDKCDLLALARLATVVKECHTMQRRESQARYSRSAASKASARTIPNGSGRSIDQGTLDEIEARLSLM